MNRFNISKYGAIKLVIVYSVLLLLAVERVWADGAQAFQWAKVPQARAISIAITKQAKAANIEREILSCVLQTESSYRMGGISDTNDYGIAQINAKTAMAYDLDLDKLLTDINYSVGAAASILADYRRTFKSSEINTWIARYNIGHQRLTTPNIGSAYVQYNFKIWTCIHSGNYL